jgi:hypothetical protein
LAIKRAGLVKHALDLLDEAGKRQIELVADQEREALERVMLDCEVHFLLRDIQFPSMADFYKFLYTEIKFHAGFEGAGFENAKEAYVYLAQKYHSAKFDQLFLGFFNESLGGNPKFSRQELIARIEGVDFQAAAEYIAYTFRETAKKVESEGVRYIGMKEFVDAIDHYIRKPCLERAITLLGKYPSWLGLFELTKDPLIIKLRNLKKSKR